MKSRLFLVPMLVAGLSAHAAELPGIPQFIDEMVGKHQFRRDELVLVFTRAEHRPDVIEAISRPATIKPWLEYRAAFINTRRIEGGIKFWKEYAPQLRRASKQFGVPQEIIVAVIGVETLYGRNVGRHRTLDALTTLAFDYPRRAPFFRSELENYLLLARDQGFDLLSVQSSYAGALGIPQFMPSSYRKFALDYNHNGKVDLLNESQDAIGSVANYLKEYGWRSGEPVALRAKVSDVSTLVLDSQVRETKDWHSLGVTAEVLKQQPLPPAALLDFTVAEGKEYWLAFENFRVITLYNNSNFYAMSVFQLAEELKKARRQK